MKEESVTGQSPPMLHLAPCAFVLQCLKCWWKLSVTTFWSFVSSHIQRRTFQELGLYLLTVTYNRRKELFSVTGPL